MKKVLIVDDEMDMRIFLSTLFATNGYMPIVSKDGKEGIQKVREESPDLIILDVMMQGKGGVYMYQELKTDPKLMNIPLIMLSGVKKKAFCHCLNMFNIQEGDNLPPPEAYVEKPPEPEELLGLAEKFLGWEE